MCKFVTPNETADREEGQENAASSYRNPLFASHRHRRRRRRPAQDCVTERSSFSLRGSFLSSSVRDPSITAIPPSLPNRLPPCRPRKKLPKLGPVTYHQYHLKPQVKSSQALKTDESRARLFLCVNTW